MREKLSFNNSKEHSSAVRVTKWPPHCIGTYVSRVINYEYLSCFLTKNDNSIIIIVVDIVIIL